VCQRSSERRNPVSVLRFSTRFKGCRSTRDKADRLQEAGIDRSLCFVTNAVKHFKSNDAADSAFMPYRTPVRSNVARGGWAENLSFFSLT
jgi:hypothetical protein